MPKVVDPFLFVCSFLYKINVSFVDPDMVFRVLQRKETEEGTVISAKVKNLGIHAYCQKQKGMFI